MCMAHSTKSSVPDPTEFEIIERYFMPLASAEGLGLKDDAACFRPPSGQDVIVTKDMLVAERHFFADDKPEDIAFKALSVNVSDLAAKGAVPQHYLLGLSLPKQYAEHGWLEGFARGLGDAQKTYNMTLVGGDTVSVDGPVCISITAFGYVSEDTMVKRSGASVGDDIYVSGTLGDAAFGLRAIQAGQGQRARFLRQYHRPLARAGLGNRLTSIATAAADVSDGLLADLNHICSASSVGARLYQAKIPLSDDAKNELAKDTSLWPLILSGGDDYEIVFTARSKCTDAVAKLSQELGLQLTKIGVVTPGPGLELVDCTDKLVQVAATGFKHF